MSINGPWDNNEPPPGYYPFEESPVAMSNEEWETYHGVSFSSIPSKSIFTDAVIHYTGTAGAHTRQPGSANKWGTDAGGWNTPEDNRFGKFVSGENHRLLIGTSLVDHGGGDITYYWKIYLAHGTDPDADYTDFVEIEIEGDPEEEIGKVFTANFPGGHVMMFSISRVWFDEDYWTEIASFGDTHGEVVVGLDRTGVWLPSMSNFCQTARNITKESANRVFKGFTVAGAESQDLATLLMAGFNMSFQGTGDGVLKIDMVPGAGKGPVECDDSSVPIVSIKSIPPSANGNFTVASVDCLRITPVIPVDLSLFATETDPQDVFKGEGLDEDDLTITFETESPPDQSTGITIQSDCVPCCSCKEYSQVSRAVSRQGAKLMDLITELKKTTDCSSRWYLEALDLIRENTPGLMQVIDIKPYPGRIIVYVQNKAALPGYAHISVQNTWGEVEVVELAADQPQLVAELTIEQPPLQGLASSRVPSGLETYEDSEDFRNDPDGISLTLGFGPNFDPIPSWGISYFIIEAETAMDKLEALSVACDQVRAFHDPANSEALAADVIYQAALEAIADGNILTADCFPDKQVFAGSTAAADGTGSASPDQEELYKCNVLSQTETLVRARNQALIYFRRLTLAFDQEVLGVQLSTTELDKKLADAVAALESYPVDCDGGEYDCVTDEFDVMTCTSAINSSSCIMAVAAFYMNLSRLAEDMDRILAEQVEASKTKIREILSSGMMSDIVETLDLSVSGYYGIDNVTCKAHNTSADTGRRDELGDPFDCLSSIVDYHRASFALPEE